jgi:hypothetical protein
MGCCFSTPVEQDGGGERVVPVPKDGRHRTRKLRKPTWKSETPLTEGKLQVCKDTGCIPCRLLSVSISCIQVGCYVSGLQTSICRGGTSSFQDTVSVKRSCTLEGGLFWVGASTSATNNLCDHPTEGRWHLCGCTPHGTLVFVGNQWPNDMSDTFNKLIREEGSPRKAMGVEQLV